jgi:hypothetical protein
MTTVGRTTTEEREGKVRSSGECRISPVSRQTRVKPCTEFHPSRPDTRPTLLCNSVSTSLRCLDQRCHAPCDTDCRVLTAGFERLPPPFGWLRAHALSLQLPCPMLHVPRAFLCYLSRGRCAERAANNSATPRNVALPVSKKIAPRRSERVSQYVKGRGMFFVENNIESVATSQTFQPCSLANCSQACVLVSSSSTSPGAARS